MKATRDDVLAMVGALFTLISRLDRAKRQRRGASTLDLLQIIGSESGIRPSDIAVRRAVHPSLVTRQMTELEEAGYVAVTRDPDDRRAWRAALTASGEAEMTRLQGIGTDRFAHFVDDWDAGEVRTLATLLEKLTTSMAAVDQRERSEAPEPGPHNERRHTRRRG